MRETFRSLLRRAFVEATAEFAEVVDRRITALMGDGPHDTSKISKTSKAPRATTQRRASPAHMDDLRGKIYDVIPIRDERGASPLSKKSLMALARVPASEATRVRNVLSQLVKDGSVTLHGTRGSAKYDRRK